MASPGVLWPRLRPFRAPCAFQTFARVPCTRRQFITLPGTEVISLKESRVLPYNSTTLYKIISDIDQYSKFIPYCQKSQVTKWSNPDQEGNKWPEEADLKIGWGGFEETYTSKLFCVPGSIVEALGGDAVTTLPWSQLQHHTQSSIGSPATSNAIFKRMATRWTIKSQDSVASPQTLVNLDIEFQFSNPVFGAVSKAVAPKLAEVMIEAFQKRARSVLGAAVVKQASSKPSNPLDSVFGR